MTATTVSARPARLAGRGRSGGDAQEWAATNPVAALPCARTPLLHPLSIPLLIPLLLPPPATVGVAAPAGALFGLVGGLWGSWRSGGPLEQGCTLARLCLVGPPPTPWGASRRAALVTVSPFSRPAAPALPRAVAGASTATPTMRSLS
jgi:hypothetical protein